MLRGIFQKISLHMHWMDQRLHLPDQILSPRVSSFNLFPRRCLPGVRLLSRKFPGGRVAVKKSVGTLLKITKAKII
jgi:hypothetical protein